MHDITSPRNRDKMLLELEVGNPAMIGQLRAAGDLKAQQVLGGRWLEIGFASCANAGTVMDTGFVEKKFKQFEQDMEKIRQNMVDDFKHQFSLDNADGPVTKLLKQVHQINDELAGQLGKGNIEHREGLEQCITALARQLSTDDPTSSLSRLVRAVTEGSQKVAGQLTLDDPTSALSRMHGSLTGLLETQNTGAQEFQQNVTATLSTGLAAFTTRRELEAKSTLHGLTFQDRVLAYFADLAGRRGHVFEDVSSRPGLIPRCKTGDGLLKVGPEYLAKDAPISVEAKDELGYSVPKMLAESEEGRKNRGTTFGVFVISARCAPPGMPAFKPYGNDLVVKWDDEDPATDVYLDAAADVACALATRQAAEKKGQSVDFTNIDRAINSIEKKANGLGQIFIWATTIKNAADKILDESKPKHAALITELVTLRDLIAAVRTAAGAPASDSIVPESRPF